MPDVAIRVENLSKRYRIGARQPQDTLRESISHAVRRVLRSNGRTTSDGLAVTTDHIWALHDVSFDVRHGEVLGVIGRNGAGKSTLLKLLSRITEPTSGRVEIDGRVASLLEVGTGFHPELTGRENILLNGAILGMRRAEIVRRFDEIVSFAEVGQFIDTPVKHYSSGMYMRLAFAVAAHLEPEVLLVDEVLAVGDAVFQSKCLGKMDEVSRSGRTILFVSHNLDAIAAICDRVQVYDAGRLTHAGPTDEAVNLYKQLNAGSGEVLHRVTDLLRWRGIANRGHLHALAPQDDVRLDLLFESGSEPIANLHVDVSLQNDRGETVIHCRSCFVNRGIDVPSHSALRATYVVDSPKLAPGSYSMTVYAYSPPGKELFWAENIDACYVTASPYFGLVQHIDHHRAAVIPPYELAYELTQP